MENFEQRLKDISDNPERHKHHDIGELTECCREEGTITISATLMEAHPAIGYNGGQKCDVYEGPCSCGAWH